MDLKEFDLVSCALNSPDKLYDGVWRDRDGQGPS